MFSAAAYRDEETFRRTTGIAKCKLIVDKNERNTHVSKDHDDLESLGQHADQETHQCTRGLQSVSMPSVIMSAAACAGTQLA